MGSSLISAPVVNGTCRHHATRIGGAANARESVSVYDSRMPAKKFEILVLDQISQSVPE
jgi:hypothetical protein